MSLFTVVVLALKLAEEPTKLATAPEEKFVPVITIVWLPPAPLSISTSSTEDIDGLANISVTPEAFFPSKLFSLIIGLND